MEEDNSTVLGVIPLVSKFTLDAKFTVKADWHEHQYLWVMEADHVMAVVMSEEEVGCFVRSVVSDGEREQSGLIHVPSACLSPVTLCSDG